MIATLLEMYALKALPRTGWLQMGVSDPESVAAHAWGVSLLALLLCPPALDRERVLCMAVLHDLAEVRTGDLTPRDPLPQEERSRREREALRALLSAFDAARRDALLEIWDAWDRVSDDEARFVRQLDKLDLALQTGVYERRGHDLEEFRRDAEARVTDPRLRRLLPWRESGETSPGGADRAALTEPGPDPAG
jgi:putative hydrolase of HD superfamily